MPINSSRPGSRWLVALALALLAATQALAERRALLIGNDAYLQVPGLRNARADADAMAQALARGGWQVQLYKDRPLRQMLADIRAFRQSLAGGDEVVVFFSGHGVQLGGTNYLLPTDVGAENEDQVRDDAVSLARLLSDLRERQPRFLLAIVDACRDNPFSSAGKAIGGRGLTGVAGATGQMVIYAAGEGQRALDRLGAGDTVRNGVFTRVLLKEMAVPGVPIREVLYRVRDEVAALAESVRHEQVPAVYDQVRGTFFFMPPVPGAAPQATVQAAAPMPPPPVPAPAPAAAAAPPVAVAAAVPSARPPAVAAPPAPDAGLRPGQVLVYRITDLLTNITRDVRLRVDRLEADRTVFDGGARVEQVGTGKLLDGQVQLGDLDRLAPPQGWWQPSHAVGQTIERQYAFRANFMANVVGPVTAGRMPVAGGAEQPVLLWKPKLTTAPYDGTSFQGDMEVWYAPALGRVVDFRSSIRPSRLNGAGYRERVQLIAIE